MVKLALAHVPTPITRFAALDALVGTAVWVKRDDMTGGPEAGNKVRKLEYLLAAACDERAAAVITCGGEQSNHARATAVLARRLGMRPILLLRTAAPPPRPWQGNLMLCRMLNAEIRFITPAQYRERGTLMADLAQERAAVGERCYVIPEGGSNGLGSLGYVDAMAEVRSQLDAAPLELPTRFDAIVHACGSGGTAAGVALGSALHAVADRVIAMAVCDDRAYFERTIAALIADARTHLPRDAQPVPIEIVDAYKGPGYAVPSAEQMRFILQVAERTGLMLDPVYTGKALFGLAQLPVKPANVLFVHTGGLPGLLAEAPRFA